MNLNGKNYHDMIVTAEEKLVIDAMRAGGKTNVFFHTSTLEEVSSHFEAISKDVLPYRRTMDLAGNAIAFEMGPEFFGDMSIVHLVEIKKH